MTRCRFHDIVVDTTTLGANGPRLGGGSGVQDTLPTSSFVSRSNVESGAEWHPSRGATGEKGAGRGRSAAGLGRIAGGDSGGA